MGSVGDGAAKAALTPTQGMDKQEEERREARAAFLRALRRHPNPADALHVVRTFR